MTARFTRFIVEHFAAHRRRSKWSFFWRISIESLVIPMVVLLAVSALVDVPARTDLDGFSAPKLLVLVVIVAPFIETLLSQAFPVMIARRLGFGFWTQVLFSIPFFAVPHLPSGIATVIGAGVISGFYIAFTYVHWRQQSLRTALWMTSGVHAFHNLTLIVPFILTRETG
jgi:hypothetical protein